VNPNAALPQVLMRIKNGITNYYIYGAGLLYQITEAATGTNTLTYHYDYRGSTVALSGDNGLVTDRIEYALYGLTTYRFGTNDTPFLFNGRYGVQTDPNGLLYMRSRYYNPYLCRFVNPDPSGFNGGLNFYVYAAGNPVSYLDPFGLNAQSTGDTSQSWVNYQPPGTTLPEIYQQQINTAQAENADTFGNALDFGLNFLQAVNTFINPPPANGEITGTLPFLPGEGGGFGSLIPSAAEGGTTTLFRTVSDAEVKSINASEQYTAYNTEGKYFYPTAEQAQAQAVENYAARQGSQTLTSVTVPNSVLKGGQSINPLGEGPAFFFPTEQLPQLGKPTVWNFWPLH